MMRQNGSDKSKTTCHDATMTVLGDAAVECLHLDCIETGHVHLNKPVLPVVPWDSGVVDAA